MMQFLSKADTLESLREKVTASRTLPSVIFTKKSWHKARETLLPDMVFDWMKQSGVIVRSSSAAEDSAEQSLAGYYDSVANITSKASLFEAIDKVSTAFDSDEDQLFIQPMLTEVAVSGVIFSREPNAGGHYYIINYDDVSGKTDTVTGGSSNTIKTLYCAKGYEKHCTGFVSQLIKMVQELERLFHRDDLDIEFVIDKEGIVYLLQVRTLAMKWKDPVSLVKQTQMLSSIKTRFNQLNRKHPYLLGKRTLYGVMPDWNPAEIIGFCPRNLSLTLYRELITDNIWAYQRDNYGYRNLRSFPLLISFCGRPYIDVRVSFNSFIPADLSESLAEKLTDFYIDSLAASPGDHDKVEFNIILSCYSLDIQERLDALKAKGFSDEECLEIANVLLDLTNKIIHPTNGLWLSDIKKVEKLEERRQDVLSSELEVHEKIYWLIEDCKRYGTLPFAGLARAGFIAIQFLQSLVKIEVLTKEEYQGFLSSLHTVSSDIGCDFANLDKENFLEKYGHLRPGTYDILTSNYRQDPDKYFDWSKPLQEANDPEPAPFKLSLEALHNIEKHLTEHGISHSPLTLFNFLQKAIEGREKAKFIFTRSVNDVLNLVAEMGATYGYTKEQMSHIDCRVLKEFYANAYDIRSTLKGAIAHGESEYLAKQSLVLPSLITSEQDIFLHELMDETPNFVTLKEVAGTVEKNIFDSSDLSKKILFIHQADPGYDWIFSHNIAGFVTKYGGANSHMSIRAMELGIPAIIGVGEKLYNTWSEAKELHIDCSNKRVTVLK